MISRVKDLTNQCYPKPNYQIQRKSLRMNEIKNKINKKQKKYRKYRKNRKNKNQ